MSVSGPDVGSPPFPRSQKVSFEAQPQLRVSLLDPRPRTPSVSLSVVVPGPCFMLPTCIMHGTLIGPISSVEEHEIPDRINHAVLAGAKDLLLTC